MRIREEIARRIEAGEIPVGQQIPSLRDMCREFGVSSITARRALLDLVNDGLVERRGGRGAFVTGALRRRRVTVAIVGYSEAEWRRNSGSFGQLVGGIASAAWEHDAVLSVVPVGDPKVAAQSISRLLRDQQADGLLLRIAGTVHLPDEIVPPERAVRTVLIKRLAPATGAPAVLPDARTAASLAVEHLARLGHRRIALLTSVAPIDTWRDHRGGFLSAMERHGIDVRPDYLVDVANMLGDLGRAAMVRLLSLDPPPSAVVCNSDFLALSIYGAAADCGLRIPSDLSVVSFDDMEFAQHLNPPLTTVRLSYYDLGYAAAATLFRVLAGETVPLVQETPVDLIVRASTGLPSGSGDVARVSPTGVALLQTG